MPVSRRTVISSLLAASGLAVSGPALTGCGGRVNRRDPAGGLDLDRLAAGFAPLAARARPGVFNLGVMTLDKPAVWCADQNQRFPLAGLAATPLAAAALAEADAGRLRLDERLKIGPEDLSPPPGLINRHFPPGNGTGSLELPVADLIALAVQEADNTAADALMRRIGGPGAVTAWLRAHQINDLRVDRYAREIGVEALGLASFRPAWKDPAAWAAAGDSLSPAEREAAMTAYVADPRDTTTGPAALNLLDQLAGRLLLSPESTALLLRLMTRPRAGALAAGLPPGASLAGQAGASTTDLGFTAAANAMGVVTLAGGRRLAIVALMSGSTATSEQRGRLFADASRMIVSAMR